MADNGKFPFVITGIPATFPCLHSYHLTIVIASTTTTQTTRAATTSPRHTCYLNGPKSHQSKVGDQRPGGVMDRAGEGMTGDRGGMQGGQGQGLEMRLHRAPGKFSLSYF